MRFSFKRRYVVATVVFLGLVPICGFMAGAYRVQIEAKGEETPDIKEQNACPDLQATVADLKAQAQELDKLYDELQMVGETVPTGLRQRARETKFNAFRLAAKANQQLKARQEAPQPLDTEAKRLVIAVETSRHKINEELRKHKY
jgi:ElaB/YqjD/DUF883 family membrane-anchored ribosome-binding protein